MSVLAPQLAHIFQDDGTNRDPGDVTNDLLRELRDGGAEDEDDDDADTEVPLGHAFPPTPIAAPSKPTVHEVIQRVWDSPDGKELLAVARVIEERSDSKNSLVFHTPVGDVRIPVVDVNGDPAMMGHMSLFTVTVRDNGDSFRPLPGVPLVVSLNHSNRRVTVTCLAEPAKLYKGLGIDLLCFVTQDSPVEKNGKLEEGAPSVVSGNPSVKVDQGEPVALGEKAASVKDFDKARALDGQD